MPNRDANARLMLLTMAQIHGIRDEVAALLEDCPELPEESLADLCREARAATGFSKSHIARRGNLARSSLDRVEGEGCPQAGIRTLQQISYAYRIPFVRVVLAQAQIDGISCAPGAKPPPGPSNGKNKKRAGGHD
ncbi:hypothetical protein [uncultured Mameliella sp.]|mgnify:CR=1 FL=1|uniref:hypothetical protein n=1 Tax=uncultured Mameliella sp. TaxID=1447087 RepID=UPI002613AE6F|nr:hypothetical protein [uncultured Mameliella sp.]